MQNAVVRALVDGIDKTNKWLSQLVSWFTLLMVIITFLIVLLRYGFNLGWIAMQESVMYLHAMVFLLGSAHALKCNEHVRVDIFYRGFSAQRKAWIDILGSLFLLLPVNIFILIVSWGYVSRAWSMFEGSQEAGGLPFVFILKTLILLFALTMTLQGLAEIIRNSIQLQQGEQK